MHGPDVLIDTPEESKQQLNRSQVTRIAAGLYSHWHPDHTAGPARLGVAQLRVPLVAAPVRDDADLHPRARLGRLRGELRPRRPVPLHGAPGHGRRSHQSPRTSRSSSTASPSRRSRSTPRTRTPSSSRATGKRVLIAMDETHGWTPPDLGAARPRRAPGRRLRAPPVHRRADDPRGVLQAAGAEDALRHGARDGARARRAAHDPLARRGDGPRLARRARAARRGRRLGAGVRRPAGRRCSGYASPGACRLRDV